MTLVVTLASTAPYAKALVWLGLIGMCCVGVWLSRRRRFSLPPGPRGKYTFSVDREVVTRATHLHVLYMEWAKKYGPIMYYTLGNRQFLVVSSSKIASDLLNKRSSKYSDRQNSVMGNKLVGFDDLVFRISMNHPRFPIYRRMFLQEVGKNAMPVYQPIQEDDVRIFLGDLLRDPDHFLRHIRRNTGSSTMRVAYGYEVEPDNDPFLTSVGQWFLETSNIVRIGRWAVDSYPFLQYLPTWFPGAEFKRIAARQRVANFNVLSAPVNWVKEQMRLGIASPSFVSRSLSKSTPLSAEEEDIVRNVAAGMYLGGADTSAATMATFFLVMMLYPEVQKRAQEEIDSVIGLHHLPTPKDRERLPYVNALITELFRWHPPVPLVQHRLVEDDEYEGMFIPSGTVVHGDVWAMCHDPSVYPSPEMFIPERYLFHEKSMPSPQPDPRKLMFGFGRRVCPGIHFAESSIFLTVASTLSAFDISKPLDESGNEVMPVVEFQGGIVSHPKPFQCRIVPRTPAITSLLSSFVA